MRDNSFAGTARHHQGELAMSGDPGGTRQPAGPEFDQEGSVAMINQEVAGEPGRMAGDVVQHRAFRWGQLVLGIICMGLIANLQYGWTLFVNPIEAKNHWGLSAI